MATYKKITDVDAVEKNDQMNVLVDDSGALKKVPVGEMGGGGLRIAIINWDSNSNHTCDSMTFEEAKAAIIAGSPVLFIDHGDDGIDAWFDVIYDVYYNYSTNYIYLGGDYIWTADGIESNVPA